jgi:hypothetical protein
MKWVLGLGASIFAIAMGLTATTTIPAATVSIDDAIFKFLPTETQGIVFIDVAALRNASLVRDALKDQKLTSPRGWDDFVQATGMVPERDIDKVTIGKLDAQDGLVIIQGRIDKFKIEQYVKDRGKQSQTYLGQSIYRDDGDGAFVLLDNVVLVGKVNAVKKAIDQMQLPGSAPLRRDLIAAMQTIEAGNQVWGVGDFSVNDLGTLGVRGPAPAVEMLKSLKSGTYQMRVDTGLHARAIGNFADAESAKNIVDLARGALAVAKLQVAKDQPDIVQLLDGIQVSNSGPTLTVRIEEAGDLLMKLKDVRSAPLPGH